MGDVYLIQGVRRDAAGAITCVAWCKKMPYSVCVETDVADVIVALRDGVQVKVAVAHIVFGGVQVSADGTTIVDDADAHSQPFRLADMPLLAGCDHQAVSPRRPPSAAIVRTGNVDAEP